MSALALLAEGGVAADGAMYYYRVCTTAVDHPISPNSSRNSLSWSSMPTKPREGRVHGDGDGAPLAGDNTTTGCHDDGETTTMMMSTNNDSLVTTTSTSTMYLSQDENERSKSTI